MYAIRYADERRTEIAPIAGEIDIADLIDDEGVEIEENDNENEDNGTVDLGEEF